MSLLLAAMVVAVFALVLKWLSLPARAREVGTRARDSLGVLRDPALDDRAKEVALRRQALRLFGLLGILVGGSLLALGLPLAVVWLLDLGGVASVEAVVGVLERADFLVGVAVIGIVGHLVIRRAG